MNNIVLILVALASFCTGLAVGLCILGKRDDEQAARHRDELVTQAMLRRGVCAHALHHTSAK